MYSPLHCRQVRLVAFRFREAASSLECQFDVDFLQRPIATSLQPPKDPISLTFAAGCHGTPEFRLNLNGAGIHFLNPILVESLIDYLHSPNAKPIEISQWEATRRENAGLSEEEWVLYATTQLAVQGIETELQMAKSKNTYNSVFDDVMAFTTV